MINTFLMVIIIKVDKFINCNKLNLAMRCQQMENSVSCLLPHHLLCHYPQ